MADQQNEVLIQHAPSQETVEAAPRSGSNAKALKAAGFTLLACLLIAGQALTVYFVLGQNKHITDLEQTQQNLKQVLTRKAVVPAKMHLPMSSLPLLKDFSEEDQGQGQKSGGRKRVPLTRLQSSTVMNQKEGSGVVEDQTFPRRMMSIPMGGMPLMPEAKVPVPAEELGSKCLLEASKVIQPGVYRPQCDEQGNYLPMQCWHSTGYCWCVDKDGHEIGGTRIRGRPQCDGGDVNAAFLDNMD
ncbi:CD74 molecule, major histocompatibility complex, class II invariant chain a [Chanos chanos]|uniref:CD74 molecule, major histocompatibility complex, class II invariant chain a n=1 Tax=Chanos chanos TaxID=29144 RepID=A0A6J2UMR4_CHACN|nr:H-2 class II histocompatibility antigen gamma chain-like [Chanos chanos]